MHLIIWGIVIAATIGGAVAFAAPRLGGDDYRVTRFEFVAGMLLCSLIVVPAVTWGGTKIAFANNMSFDEYWNGWETEATRKDRTCHRDGSCRWTYDCDPYTVTVTRTRTVPDGDGGTKTETYTDTETRYHSCPYVTVEHTYVVDTTLGPFTIAANRFPSDPEAHRWRAHKSVSRVAGRAGVGAPAEWLEAKARLDAGDPGPVTVVKPYDNYVLASQHSTLRSLSTDIDRYLDAGLIPDPAAGLTSSYRANKTHLVGVRADAQVWRDAVDRLSSALGTERQGDLHFVAVDSGRVDDADTYTQALMASWKSPERGDQGLAKNAVVVVVGVDGDEVSWARLDTGMPVGNEDLVVAVRDKLRGERFDAAHLIGHATAKVAGGDVTVDPGDGLLAQLLFDDTGGFTRVCMVCDDPDDEGLGFTYLASEIRPTAGQSAAIIAAGAVLSTLIWAAFAAFAVGPHNRRKPGGGGTGPESGSHRPTPFAARRRHPAAARRTGAAGTRRPVPLPSRPGRSTWPTGRPR